MFEESDDLLKARLSQWMQQGAYADALPLCDVLVQRLPDDATLWFTRGLAHYQLRQLTFAIADFTQALALDPTNGDLLYMRANAFLRSLKPIEAQQDIDRAIILLPQRAELYAVRAQAWVLRGDRLRAIDDYHALLALEPTNTNALMQRARLHLDVGDMLDAAADATRLLNTGVERPQIYTLRGLAYQQLGRFEESIRDFSEAIARDKRYADAYAARAGSHASLAQNDAAIADYTQALAIAPTAALHVLRSAVYLLRGAAGDVVSARRDASDALHTDAEHRPALYYRALAYYRLHKPDKALADLWAFVGMDSVHGGDDRDAVAWLILLLMTTDDAVTAREQVTFAREFYPSLADAAAVSARLGWQPAEYALYASAWAAFSET